MPSLSPVWHLWGSLKFRTTPQGCDMLLMWVPKRHVVLASAVEDFTLWECGAVPPPRPVRKLILSWISLVPRARHTYEEFRKVNSHCIAQAKRHVAEARPAHCLRPSPMAREHAARSSAHDAGAERHHSLVSEWKDYWTGRSFR